MNCTVTEQRDCELAANAARDLQALLVASFGVNFHIYSASGDICLRTGDSYLSDEGWLREAIRTSALKNEAEILAQDGAVTLLALPIDLGHEEVMVALAPFVTHHDPTWELARVARLLGVDETRSLEWMQAQPVWPLFALQRLAEAVLTQTRECTARRKLEHDLEQLSGNLATCYEEISLLHGITQNFRISNHDEELGQEVLDALSGSLSCEGLCLLYLPVAKHSEVTYKARTQPVLLQQGDCPLKGISEILELVDRLGMSHGCRPLVLNETWGDGAQSLPPGVRQLILAPLMEGTRVFGYLLAFNQINQQEFGSVEANLLASVGAMLGIHSANRDLYREQAELLANVVQALTSAIDAKDPYTCGHSDRVARVATRLAQELGCDTEFLSAIYMAGLLHDIGKIGIDDAVLRKPGALTEAEFEHIKEHPGLGYRILADIKQLAHVLPAVLHHHEQWDGRGYPCQLAGESIPLIARVLAVADSYDAMTSDRPYRPGMPEEKVAAIFRKGAGQQWDAEVVNAFFNAVDDIRKIVNSDRAGLSLDVQQWLEA